MSSPVITWHIAEVPKVRNKFTPARKWPFGRFPGGFGAVRLESKTEYSDDLAWPGATVEDGIVVHVAMYTQGVSMPRWHPAGRVMTLDDAKVLGAAFFATNPSTLPVSLRERQPGDNPKRFRL